MSTTTISPQRDIAMAQRLGRKRHRLDAVFRWLAITATLVGLVFLTSIIVTLFWRGIESMSLTVFTDVTRPPGSSGGLLNANVGTPTLSTIALPGAVSGAVVTHVAISPNVNDRVYVGTNTGLVIQIDNASTATPTIATIFNAGSFVSISSIGVEQLARFCGSCLARFKLPRHVKVVRELPRTPTGKPDYRGGAAQLQRQANG